MATTSRPIAFPKGAIVIIKGGEYHAFEDGEVCIVKDVPAVVNGETMVPLQSKRSMRIQAVRPVDFQVMSTPEVTRPMASGGAGGSGGSPMTIESLRTAFLEVPPLPRVTPYPAGMDWGQSEAEALAEVQKVVEEVAETPKVKKIKKPKKLAVDTVVLSHEKKEEIKAAISQLKNNDLIFNQWGFGQVFEKGTAVTMLFYGVPGTGKTLMAQAIAEEHNAELKIYGMAEIGSSEPGGSERIIQKIFAEAKEFFFQEKKQRVILFDECDSLLYDRSKVGVILGAQINALLSEIERHEGIVIFTTNRIATLDPALERRITAKIEFPFPDEEQRLAIWERMLPEEAPLAKDVQLKKLAKAKIPGGNIKNAVLNAVRMAAYQNGKQIEMAHFLKAVEREMNAIAAFENGRDHRQHIEGDLGMDMGRKLTVKRDLDMNMKIKNTIRREENTHAS